MRSHPPPQRTPSDILECDTHLRRFGRALQQLSSKKREVFVLVTLEGLSGREVADALKVAVATVWTRLHHARRELRTALEGGDL